MIGATLDPRAVSKVLILQPFAGQEGPKHIPFEWSAGYTLPDCGKTFYRLGILFPRFLIGEDLPSRTMLPEQVIERRRSARRCRLGLVLLDALRTDQGSREIAFLLRPEVTFERGKVHREKNTALNRLVSRVANGLQIAHCAVRFPRKTDTSSVPDQLMGKLNPLFSGEDGHQISFNFFRLLMAR